MAKVSHDALLELLGRVSLHGIRAVALINKKISGFVQQLTNAVGVMVLILKGNRLQMHDLNALQGFDHLRWVDLSGNQIKELPRAEVWQQLTELQVLYLHENLLSDWDSVRPLEVLPRVLHITLFNNPIVHLLGYRHYMVSEIQSLLVLDFYVVTDEERITDVSYSQHFKTLTESTKFPLQEAETTNEADLLGLYSRTIYKLRRKYERCSAIIRIQSLWRGYKVRKNIGGFVGKRDQAATTIQRYIRGFLLRNKLKKDLESLLKNSNKQFLLYEPEEYVRYLAVQKIESFMISKVLKKKRVAKNTEIVAKTIQKYTRRWLQMNSNLPLKSPFLYIFRHQTGTFLSILRVLTEYNPSKYHPTKLISELHFPEFFQKLQNIHKENFLYENVVEKFQPCKSVKIIRFPDLDGLKYNKSKAILFTSWMKNARLGLDFSPSITKSTQISAKFVGFRRCKNTLLKVKSRISRMTKLEKLKFRKRSSEIELDDYHDLMVFEAPSMSFLHRILSIAQVYNSQVSGEEYPLFMPLIEECVRKIAAVCFIQAFWRGYKQRKHPTVAETISKQRAVVCVQRWWRNVLFLKRLLCLQQVKHYITRIESPTVYMEEHTFACLRDIHAEHTSRLKTVEGKLLFKPLSCDLSLFKPHSHRGIPLWLDLNFPTFRMETDFSPDSLENLLQFNCDLEKTVLHKVTSHKSYLSDAELGLIQFNFENIEIAKRKIAFLYLKTFDFRHNLGVFFLTKDDLEEDFLMPKVKKLWKVFKIDLNRIARIKERIKTILMKETPLEIEEKPIQTPPKPKINLENIVKEIEANQSRGESAISTREIAQWRIKRAKEDIEKREIERKTMKDQEFAMKKEKINREKERIMELLEEKEAEIGKERELRLRMRSKEAEISLRMRSEREFVHSFALNCNMLSKQMIKSQITRVKRKIRHEKTEYVREFKEKWAKEREVQMSINYERFKMKQERKNKTEGFDL